MNSRDIIERRLANQQLAASGFGDSPELVRWMGCIQAQDFAGAKWAVGNRVKGGSEAAIEKGFNEGRFLRTHVLRPTWHFVAPEDIRWMLGLTGPRIKAFNKNYHRSLEIGPDVLKRSKTVLTKALTGGRHLDRKELAALLLKARINTDDIRLTFLLMDAELDGLICSGPRKGKQFTYALLDERVAPAAVLSRPKALGELAKRYFTSRGPATLPDFAWWGGLTLTDAREGLEYCRAQLQSEIVNGQAYWFSTEMHSPQKTATAAATVLLLPAYDEYAVAYKDRSDIVPEGMALKTGYSIFKPIIVVGGKVVGVWQRTLTKDGVAVETDIMSPLSKAAEAAIKKATRQYGDFVGRKVVNG